MMPDQRSVTDQLLDLFEIQTDHFHLVQDKVDEMDHAQLNSKIRQANALGMYDAADWLRKQF